MPGRLNHDSARAWRSFLEAHAGLVAAIERELARGGHVSLAWHDVLAQLAQAGGRMRMQELARSVLLSKSGLTRLVDRMEAAGLVRRQPAPEDARGTVAVITPSGRAALRRSAPVYARAVREHFASALTDAEARAIANGLAKVAQRAPVR
jgi:DNA-binding MarR family transcriptional regulator